MAWLLFENRYRLFQRHDERLRLRPEPQTARRNFQTRLAQARRVQQWRLGVLVIASMGLVTTAATGLASQLETFQPMVGLARTIASATGGLTILLGLGIILANRLLSLLDLELSFYSAESREKTN